MRLLAAVVCLSVALAAWFLRPHVWHSARARTDPRPWSLKRASNGFSLTWDRTTPPLRDAAHVELVLQREGKSTATVLDRTAGTIVVPYMPEAVVLRVDSRAYPLIGPPPAPSAPHQLTGASAAQATVRFPRRETFRIPMLLSTQRRRVVSTARLVMPRVPAYVLRAHSVDLRIKVAPTGKVLSVASHYGNDPLRNKLSAVASDAIKKWQFDRIAVNSYRNGTLRLVFTPRGVTVEPRPQTM